jgi:PAS domain S-box-containing protein
MALSYRRKYASAGLVIGGCAVFLFLAVAVIFIEDQSFRQIRALIADTRDVLGDVSELNILIRDAERGQRGYLLSGNAEYLEPYDAALTRLPSVVERLRGRSAETPARRQEFEALRTLLDGKLTELARTVQVRTAFGEEPARQILMTGEGQGLMVAITAALETVADQDTRLLSERRESWERREAWTRLLIAAGSAMTAVLLALAVLVSRRDAAERRDLAREREQRVRSELERTHSELREMTARNAASPYARSLLEASLDPMVAISPDGMITDVNEATVKATRTPREALVGTDFSNYFTEPVKAREALRRVFADGSVTDYPLTIRGQNEDPMDVLYNASVYRDAADDVLGVFAAARDVTARTRAETAIAEQRGRDLDRLARLERFYEIAIGRELKMIELKKEIAELKTAVDSRPPDPGVGLNDRHTARAVSA